MDDRCRNEQWYRHDAADNQWVVNYPAALAQWEKFRQAQQPRSSGEEGGMATETVYELPPAYLEPTEPGTGAPIVDDRGVEIGKRPPTKDDLYTIPSTAAFSSELPDQQVTAPSDPQDARTQPSQAAIDHANVIPRAIDGDYELDASPIVKELLESQRSRTLRTAAGILVVILVVALVGAIVAAGGIMFWYRDTVEPFGARIAALANYTPEYQTRAHL